MDLCHLLEYRQGLGRLLPAACGQAAREVHVVVESATGSRNLTVEELSFGALFP